VNPKYNNRFKKLRQINCGVAVRLQTRKPVHKQAVVLPVPTEPFFWQSTSQILWPDHAQSTTRSHHFDSTGIFSFIAIADKKSP